MAIYEEVYQAIISRSRRNQQLPLEKPISKSAKSAPWWQVYLLTAVLLVALFVTPRLISGSSTTKLLEAGFVVVYYATVLRWVRRHEATLNQEALQNSKPSDLLR